MKVEIKIKTDEDIVTIIPENADDIEELNKMGHVPYKYIFAGESISERTLVLSCKK